MSRIGKLPINIPDGVDVSVKDGIVEVKGKKGVLLQPIVGRVSVEVKDGKVEVKRLGKDRQTGAYQGLMRSLINNMIIGVSKGFTKVLNLVGTGYRANVQGKKLVLNLGFSHPVEMIPPDGVTVKVDKNTKIIIEGYDKVKVGQFAANVRKLRPPEPYKGKGILYEGEIIRRKAGKAGAK